MSAQTNIVRIPTLFTNDILQHTNIVRKRHFATYQHCSQTTFCNISTLFANDILQHINVLEHGCRQDGCCCLCEERRHVCVKRGGMCASEGKACVRGQS